MTNEKLEKCNDIQQAIVRLENQLISADKVQLLPDCIDFCDKSLYKWAIPLDKAIRTYLKATVSKELNKLRKEFEKL